MECTKHTGNLLILACKNCSNEVVCGQCLIESHNGHHFISVDKAEITARQQLQNKVSDNAQYVSDLDIKLQSITDAKHVQKTACDDIDKEIETIRLTLHELVDTAAEELRSESRKKLKKKQESLEEQYGMISKQREKARKYGSHLKEIINQHSKVEIIQRSKDLKPFKTVQLDLQIPMNLQLDKSTRDKTNIKNMYGKLHDVFVGAEKGVDSPNINQSEPDDLSHSDGGSDILGPVRVQNKSSIVSTFQHSQKIAIAAIAFYPRLCWIKCFADRKLKLADEKGCVYKTIKVDSEWIRDVQTCMDGTLYVCCGNPNGIRQIETQDGDTKKFINTDEFLPQGICTTKKGHIIVTLMDTFSWDTTSTSQRLLVRYGPEGQEMQRAQKDAFNEHLFVYPSRVRINEAEDTILVINSFRKDFAFLVVLDGQLNPTLRYCGKGQIIPHNKRFKLSEIDTNFEVHDAAFNSQNNIVICEAHTKSIQLISPYMDVLQVLLTDNDIPVKLALANDNKMWIGYRDGHIKILQLN